MTKSFGEIVGSAGDLGALAAHAARESDAREARATEDRMQGLWNMAVQRSRQQFGGRRLWKVLIVERRTREIVVKADCHTKDSEAMRSQARAVTLSRDEPFPFKYFVRRRINKGEPAEWVEAVFTHVDPLDYNSPKAWQLCFDKKQLAKNI